MIRKIKNSLTAKICILVAVLLLAASMITYGAVVRFLPSYYSSQLQKELDAVSQEFVSTLHGYEALEDASFVLEMFAAQYQVDVTILDSHGNLVWPLNEAVVEETAVVSDDGVVQEFYRSTLEGTEAVRGDPVEAAEEEQGAVDWSSEGMAVREVQDSIINAEAADMEAVETVQEAAVAGGSSQHFALKQYPFEVGRETYTMLVSGSMQQVNQAMEILYQIIPYILGLAMVVAVLFALLVSFYLTAPMVRLSRIAKKMAALDFSESYQKKRTDEVGLLGSSLNELSANLSNALGELRQANEKLRWDIEREREIERKRIAFFSAVSHELKTPITILKGHLCGMLQGIGEYRNRDYYLGRSLDTTEKMEDMVQELLTVSRIENNTFTTETADVAELLRQQAADMTELMEQKGLELRAEIPDHLYAPVNPGMMEKVFRNLLMNAIRYTPAHSGAQIRIVMLPEVPGNPEGPAGSTPEGFWFSVENTGVFIPQEALPRLFDAFYRVEQSRNRETGGSGLGLYIVKMVLEQHRAQYRMENTREGVRFCFTLGKNHIQTT